MRSANNVNERLQWDWKRRVRSTVVLEVLLIEVLGRLLVAVSGV
jgi:hypothetical protein